MEANGTNGTKKKPPRALVVKALSTQQLVWLRREDTQREWGQNSSREGRPPDDFNPAAIAAELEKIVPVIECEGETREPVLYCDHCQGWRRHGYECDEKSARDTYHHEYSCKTCRHRRFWGASKSAKFIGCPLRERIAA